MKGIEIAPVKTGIALVLDGPDVNSFVLSEDEALALALVLLGTIIEFRKRRTSDA